MSDLISREEVLKLPQRKGYAVNGWETYIRVSDIKELSSAQKTGKWIEQDDSWDGVYYECSVCGDPWTLIDGTPWDNYMNFCPNCGARMVDKNE